MGNSLQSRLLEAISKRGALEESLDNSLSARTQPGDAQAFIDALDDIQTQHHAVRSARFEGWTRAGWLLDLLGAVFPEENWESLDEAMYQILPEPLRIIGRDITSTLLEHIGEQLNGVLPSIKDSVDSEISSWLGEVFRAPVSDGNLIRELTEILTPSVAEWVRENGIEAPIEAVAGALDLGLSAVKVAVLIGSRQVGIDEGLEWLEDRAVAVVGMLAHQAVKLGGTKAGYWLGSAIGGVIGLAPLGAEIGRSLGGMAAGVLAEPLEIGVRQFCNAVIKTGRSIVVDMVTQVRGFINA